MVEEVHMATTPQHVTDLFGESLRKHADLISAIYCMHHAFAQQQSKFSKPELRVQHLHHEDQYVVTIRGGVGMDTRALAGLKMQESRFSQKCRQIVIDTDQCMTQYTISDNVEHVTYTMTASAIETPSPVIVMKHNKSRKSVMLLEKLSNRRMQRAICLYTRSDKRIPEFDVFLQSQQESGYMLMTINNVLRISAKFIFELLHDPIANVARVQFCASVEDEQAFELRLWFDCAHTSVRVQDEIKRDIVPKRSSRLSRMIRTLHNPY